MEGAGEDGAWGSLTRLTAPQGEGNDGPGITGLSPATSVRGRAAPVVHGTGREEAVQSRTPFSRNPVWTLPMSPRAGVGAVLGPIAQSGNRIPSTSMTSLSYRATGRISAAPNMRLTSSKVAPNGGLKRKVAASRRAPAPSSGTRPYGTTQGLAAVAFPASP